jgi:hypothetical protein
MNCSERRAVSVGGSVSGNGWKIGSDRKEQPGLDIRFRDRKKRRQKDSEFFVNVISGSEAYILVGKEIPYREKWAALCRRYAGYVERVGIQRIETGMEVSPVIVGNHAKLTIIPRISHAGPGGQTRKTIRFARAATRLSVPLGQWVRVGGVDKGSNEVMSAILESGSQRRNSSLSISLMAEAY